MCYEKKYDEYGLCRFTVSPVVDSNDVVISYSNLDVETIRFSIYLSELRYHSIFEINSTWTVATGYIGRSAYLNSLELIEVSYESDYAGSKTFIMEKIKGGAYTTLKMFDEFLKSNNIGLTLKDFNLDYDFSSTALNAGQSSTSTTISQNNTSNNNAGGGYTTNNKIKLSSFPLYLYADDGTGTFLGEINSNQYDRDSIANQYGDYGSQYKTKSIFNQYGDYGSQYSKYSVFNEYATNPPKILDRNGKVVGYLTANKYIKDAISYEEMMVLLKKFNK